MKAKMSILDIAVPNGNIVPYGGPGISPAGHNFNFVANVKVTPRTMGGLSGEDIDCPQLEWKERIDWFEYKQMIGWDHAGENTKDMYHR